MPESQPIFLAFAAAGFVGAAGMLLARKSRGRRALLLAMAFAIFAGLNLSVYFGLPEAVTWTMGGLLAVLLFADLIARAARK